MAEQEQAIINGDESDHSATDQSGDEANSPNTPAKTDAALDAATLQKMAQIKTRLKALKKIQFDYLKIESRFFEEVQKLELKYHELFEPLFKKRMTIITGKAEPTAEESNWASDDEDELTEYIASLKLSESEPNESGEQVPNESAASVKGIPEFWLTIFKRVSLISEMIQEQDVNILKHLEDVSVTFKEPMSFVLNFKFGPNEFFTNSVLTKKYYMRCTPLDDEPFSFEGPEIYKCEGCKIDWKQGMNATTKLMRKKQKNKTQGNVRYITSEVPTDSFFNFFNPPAVPEGVDFKVVEEETKELLICDFEIGHYIRERIIPRAVLYFTGEIVSDDEDDDDEEDEDEDDDFEDEGDSDGAGREKSCNQQ